MDFPVVTDTPANSDTLPTLPLECHGPFRWGPADVADTVPPRCSLLEHSAHAASPGVYLWAIPRASGVFRVHYVGEAEHFTNRLDTYYGEYFAWESRVYDSVLFARGTLKFLSSPDGVYYCAWCAKKGRESRSPCAVCVQEVCMNPAAQLARTLTPELKALMTPHRDAMVRAWRFFVIPMPRATRAGRRRPERKLWHTFRDAGGEVKAFLDLSNNALTFKLKPPVRQAVIHPPEGVRFEGLAYDAAKKGYLLLV